MRSVSRAAPRYAAAATTRTAASAASPCPAARRTPNPAAAPSRAATVPDVGATAFAMTSSSAGTTCGRLAPSPARKNRLSDRQVRTSNDRVNPTLPRSTTATTTRTSTVRTRLATSMICRRRHRSRSTPANGPTIVYGRKASVNAAAAAAAVAARSALKKTRVASPTWKAPSPACEVSRVAKSCRKSRRRTTARKSAAKLPATASAYAGRRSCTSRRPQPPVPSRTEESVRRDVHDQLVLSAPRRRG